MPKLEIDRSIQINAPAERVFEIVSDLGKWRPWNPWLVTEPEATVDVTDGGKSYTWKGRRTGEGSMKIVSETAPSEVHLDLLFLTPYKSQSKVSFRILPEGDGCRVHWTMDGSLPFFMFFFKKMMTTLIGMDYDRGLSMLKDVVETGSVPASLEWIGETNYDGCTYVGITTECSIGELGARMSEDFRRLGEWAKESSTEVTGQAFSIYQKWDLSKGTCRYTSGFPVGNVPKELPSGFISGVIPSLKVYQIGHTGPYRHLGNAWSTGMGMSRAKEFRPGKACKPFELYLNMPGEVDENEQRVKVCFPVK